MKCKCPCHYEFDKVIICANCPCENVTKEEWEKTDDIDHVLDLAKGKKK